MLQLQLDDIEKYTDRTQAQKDYLSVKSQVRYWLGQAIERGGADAMIQDFVKKDDLMYMLSLIHISEPTRPY